MPQLNATRSGRAMLALGSNLGDRAKLMCSALALLRERGVMVVRTSRMYESAPAYKTDQGAFLNAVSEVSFNHEALPPLQLLDVCKEVEAILGRDLVTGIRNGPRPVDVDILYYLSATPTALQDASIDWQAPLHRVSDSAVWTHTAMDTERLCIPHRLLAERTFVLLPLQDIAPCLEHPLLQRSTAQLLESLSSASAGAVELQPVLPSPQPVMHTRATEAEEQQREQGVGHASGGVDACVPCVAPLRLQERTLIMGVLNVTPDSFSDGGLDAGSSHAAVQRALRLQEQGAHILDVGGASSKPGAEPVNVQEELRRVLPVVREIRRCCPGAWISVDTTSAEVAKQALLAGANMLNDISAGRTDPELLKVAAEAHVPLVLMHSRGTPKSMVQAEHRQYSDIVSAVAEELQERVAAAVRAGVAPWNIVLDPGVGFAKGLPENLQILQRLGELRCKLQPHAAMLGTSRKGFIGTLTQVSQPERRVMGTAATCVMGISAGFELLRVHDVQEIKEVALMSDAVYLPLRKSSEEAEQETSKRRKT